MRKSALPLKSLAFIVPFILAVRLAAGGDDLPEPKETGKCMIWEVEAPEGGDKAWLLGSMHAAPSGIYPLDQSIMDAWGKAREVAFEIDFGDSTTKGKFLQMMMERSIYKDGGGSSKTFGKERHKRLIAYLAQIGMKNMNAIERMRPWFLSLLVEVRLLESKGWKDEFGIDSHFEDLARERGLEMSGLETLETHVKGIEDPSDEAFAKDLMEHVDDPEESIKLLKLIYDSWRMGDIAALDALDEVERKESPEIYKAMILDRNPGMASKIHEMLKSGDAAVFVIVGAGHLAGKDSVIELLRKKGYKARQLEKTGVKKAEAEAVKEAP